uniref:Nucleotide-diphospho-sugar transferase domain-containing protein n=1 Tax=Phytophthora ramorum TaxID=164328 RepID=H3GK53_PHYRM
MEDLPGLPLDADEELEISSEGLGSSEYPSHAWQKHEFQCLGWVETDDDGDELGTRRECWQRIRAGDAGYCEVTNSTSGEVFHVMHTTSLSLKDDARFTCELAKAFSSFRFHAATYRHDPPMALSTTDTEGIAMAVYDSVLPSAFASVRRLRDTGCKLPVELWFRHDELTPGNPVLVLLMENFGPVHLRQIFDERIYGFNVKVHALYYSQFASVLLLDADNFAVRDPTPLFSSTAMKRYGAVFWPDFWHPGNSIFNLHAQSLVWELLHLDYIGMLEQESGQVLVNRAVSRPMLEQLLYYATHKPNLFTKLNLVWGDKDLFRLTWLQMGRAFYYNDHRVPGTLGIVNQNRQRYCGVTMVQYDLNGKDMLFWHRNTIKLRGDDGDRKVWHTLQELSTVTGEDSGSLPKVQSFNGKKMFNETSCFGIKRFEMNALVQMTQVDELDDDLASLETTLIKYASQAYKLLHGETSTLAFLMG